MRWTCALWMAFPTVFVSIFLSPISGLGRGITMSWDVKPTCANYTWDRLSSLCLGPGDRRVPGLARPLWASAGVLGEWGASSTFHSHQGGGPRMLEPRGWNHTLWADLPVTRHPAPLGRKPPGLRVSSQFSWGLSPTLGGVFHVQTYVGFYSPCIFLHLTLSKVEATPGRLARIFRAQSPAVFTHSCSLGPTRRHSGCSCLIHSSQPV